MNVARGGVVDEIALAKVLGDGHLAGAALDVFEDEPLADESALREAPNLVLTPHLGSSTTEAQELVAEEIAEAVRAALAEGDLSRDCFLCSSSARTSGDSPRRSPQGGSGGLRCATLGRPLRRPCRSPLTS